MIRINLLRGVSHKTRKQLRISPRAVVTVVALIVIGGLIAASPRLYRYAKPLLKKRIALGPAAEMPGQKPVANKHNIIEEVVADVADSQLNLRESGLLKIPYLQLSFAEKINYEWLYMCKTLDMLSRLVPEGIGLQALEISDFQTISGTGISMSKETVSLLLTSLERESGVTLSHEYTSITSQKNQGFKFVFVCTTEFGLNLTDPAVDLSLSILPGRPDLPVLLDSISARAGRSSITIMRKPEQISSQRIGNFFQFSYDLSVRAPYKNIVSWVAEMSKAKIPAAFSKFSIKAVAPGVVNVDAVMRITISEHQ